MNGTCNGHVRTDIFQKTVVWYPWQGSLRHVWSCWSVCKISPRKQVRLLDKSGSGVTSHSSGLSILWNERGKVQECSCGLKKQVFCPRSFIIGELNEPRRIRKRHLKLKWRCFKLCRAYYTSLNSSSLGNFFWSWILKGFSEGREKKKKIVVFCSRLPPQNVRLGIFTL